MNPALADTPLPRVVRKAAIFQIELGCFSVFVFFLTLFYNRPYFDAAVVLIPAGIMVLKRRSNFWRWVIILFNWPIALAVPPLILIMHFARHPLLHHPSFGLLFLLGLLGIWAGCVFSLRVFHHRAFSIYFRPNRRDFRHHPADLDDLI